MHPTLQTKLESDSERAWNVLRTAVRCCCEQCYVNSTREQ